VSAATAGRLLAAALALFAPLHPSQAGAGAYKWQDAQGVLYFSDRPPAEGSAKQVEVRPANSFRGTQVEPVPPGPSAAKRPVKGKSLDVAIVAEVAHPASSRLACPALASGKELGCLVVAEAIEDPQQLATPQGLGYA
jgi:hypothetical protein